MFFINLIEFLLSIEILFPEFKCFVAFSYDILTIFLPEIINPATFSATD